ncbi:MAG TPA: hypothetical protein VGI96_01365 [Streptosporangiaceae bacterium]|jgi:hypothetical protein
MLTRRVAVVVTAAAALLAASGFPAVTAGAAALAPFARAAAAAGGGSGGCGASGYPWGYDIACQSGTVSAGTSAAPARAPVASHPGPGQGGTVAASPASACGLYPIAGNSGHMLQVCPDGLTVAGGRNGLNLPATANTVVAVGGGGNGGGAAAVPQVTPQQLLAWAQSQLKLPLPGVQTAPPRGSDGLVGLPEWFWVSPAQWHPATARVAVGAVWAQVTARPASITVRPGTGTTLTCGGAGTVYNPHLPAQAQHSTCTWTYSQSSDGLPGNAYPASVTVTWDASWQGSGGAGGALAPAGQTAAVAVPVAEAQALNPARS